MKLLKNPERLVFYLLVFSIPIQSRLVLHSWTQPFSQWTSAYLYGTDILLGLLFLLWIWRTRQLPKLDFNKITLFPGFWLSIFFVFSALSIINSHINSLSWYQLLKLAEFTGFYFYLTVNFGKTYELKKASLVIIASGFLQALIGIAQYLKQGSLGLRLLGESPLSVTAQGIAVFIADTHRYLRAYGSTPHPNILAAWLFTAIFSFYFYYILRQSKPGSIPKNILHEIPWLLIYAAILFAFLLTFSRVIIVLFGVGIVIQLVLSFSRRNYRQKISEIKSKVIIILSVSVAVSILFCLLYWPQVKSRVHISAEEEAVTQRVFYNQVAESVTASHPLTGIGLGQFVPDMMSKFKYLPPGLYQPDHNIYLLIASETGLLGLAVFLLFLFFTFWRFVRRVDFSKLRSFSFLTFGLSLLAMGLFDHFLLTTQQGSFIFWMTMALLASVDKV
jgi:O-antigen ligase